jgi:ABC-type multidrug transport system fused ATPase/permease subunit
MFPVGRTGSGKSTLTLALLRCIFTEGDVFYDGLSTHAMNLDALRSNITIIPQAVREPVHLDFLLVNYFVI